jgi:hypothetical protein
MDLITNFQVPVRNQFEILGEREMEVTSILNPDTSCISRQEFENSSIDKKLTVIFDELKFIRNEQVSCSTSMLTFQKSLSQVNDKLGHVMNVTNNQTSLLRTIAYKSIDLEARSRRNNLIFRGFTENRNENCYRILVDFLERSLDVRESDIYITRAHRLGSRVQGKNFSKRPIIANFRDYGNVELIMSRVSKLKYAQTGISIDYDFPKEIQEARSRLWPKFKHYRASNPRSKVVIVYPAKLIMDGHLIHDELPDWNHYLRRDRLQDIEYICAQNGHSNQHQTSEPIRQSKVSTDKPVQDNSTHTPIHMQHSNPQFENVTPQNMAEAPVPKSHVHKDTNQFV